MATTKKDAVKEAAETADTAEKTAAGTPEAETSGEPAEAPADDAGASRRRRSRKSE